MKKRIIFGSLLAVCIVMVMPSISAVQINAIEESNESLLLEKFMKKYHYNDLNDKIKSLTNENKNNFLSYGYGKILDVIILLICVALIRINEMVCFSRLIRANVWYSLSDLFGRPRYIQKLIELRGDILKQRAEDKAEAWYTLLYAIIENTRP